MIRKLAGIAWLVGCAFAGLAVAGEITSVEAEVASESLWSAEHNIVSGTPSDCQADTLSALTEALGPTAEDVVWLWAANLPVEHAAFGLAWQTEGRVALDVSIPCKILPSIVIHEWAHMVTPEDMAGGEELSADCISARLRAVLAPASQQYTPYLDRIGSCSPEATESALSVIHTHGLS